jgi:hypothetical protein
VTEGLLDTPSLQKRLAQLQAELEGPEATPLERLLVERVLLCWLQVHHADLCVAR